MFLKYILFRKIMKKKYKSMKYVLTFMKSFIFSFLLTYFAIDVWRLATTPTLTTNHSC